MKRLSILLLVVFTITSFPLLHGHEAEAGFSLFGSHKNVKSDNGVVHIPLAKISDGKAHHYQYNHDGRTIKFFVVQSPEGVIRAAFDACDVCFPSRKGYTQDGDFMICNNCGRRFHVSRINVEKGGCNPAPLKRSVNGGDLVIAVSDIVPGGRFF